MRARTPQDYKAGDKTNIREGEGLGVMGGKDKGKMNAMFDTRGKETESFQKNLDQVIEDNRRRYDRQLLSDWIVAVFRRCTLECIQPINVVPTDKRLIRLTQMLMMSKKSALRIALENMKKHTSYIRASKTTYS